MCHYDTYNLGEKIMPHTIRISDEEMKIVRQAAKTHSRSIAKQVEHWLRLGRATERSSNVSFERVELDLKAQLSIDELTGEEQEAYMEKFNERMGNFTPEIEAAYAKLGDDERNGGLDENDNLVYGSAKILT